MNVSVRKTVFIGFSVFVVYALLTGGLDVYRSESFKGHGDIQLGDVEGSWDIVSQTRQISIPFVFHYSYTGEPYSIRFQLEDVAGKAQGVRISKVVVSYRDGTSESHETRWNGNFRTTPVGRIMVALFDDVPFRSEEMTVRIEGAILTTQGAEISFVSQNDFKTSSAFGVATFWYALSRR